MFVSEYGSRGYYRNPRVSVIMPIRNERDYIESSLTSVLTQDYPCDQIQVLVVDGMSTDNTRSIVRRIAARHSDREICLLANPKHIVPTALNIGLENADGEIVIRVDGHCEIPSDYVSRCVELLRTTDADNVGGMQYTDGNDYLSNAIAIATRSPFGIGNAKYRYSNQAQYVDTVFLGAWWRQTLEDIGGFDESMVRHQDYELNVRLRQAGGRIFYSPDLKVKYYSRSSLLRLAKQYFQYGLWKGKLTNRNMGAFRWRHAAPPLLVAGMVSGAILSMIFPIMVIPYIAILAAYILASLVASCLSCRRNGWRYLPILPIIFVLLHASWGSGFWTGLVSALWGSR